MKRNFIIFIASAILVGMQACGSKSAKDTANVAVKTVPVAKVALTSAERKAEIKRETAELAEKRRISLEKQAKETPFFKDAGGNVVYYKAESDPVFIGGDEVMRDYLQKNLNYPEKAREQGIEGTVFVDFVVTKFGNVRAVEVTDVTSENVDQSFRDEAFRVVTAMPKWKPGNQNGKNVDVKFSIPITFEMN